jgi:hypothetical protein
LGKGRGWSVLKAAIQPVAKQGEVIGELVEGRGLGFGARELGASEDAGAGVDGCGTMCTAEAKCIYFGPLAVADLWEPAAGHCRVNGGGM